MGIYHIVGGILIIVAIYGAVVSILQEFSMIPRGSWGVPYVPSTLLMAVGLSQLGIPIFFKDITPDFLAIPLIICGSVICISGLRLDARKRRDHDSVG